MTNKEFQSKVSKKKTRLLPGPSHQRHQDLRSAGGPIFSLFSVFAGYIWANPLCFIAFYELKTSWLAPTHWQTTLFLLSGLHVVNNPLRICIHSNSSFPPPKKRKNISRKVSQRIWLKKENQFSLQIACVLVALVQTLSQGLIRPFTSLPNNWWLPFALWHAVAAAATNEKSRRLTGGTRVGQFKQWSNGLDRPACAVSEMNVPNLLIWHWRWRAHFRIDMIFLGVQSFVGRMLLLKTLNLHLIN